MLAHELEADPRLRHISDIEQQIVREAVDALPPGATVADVPCGNGRMSQWVVRRGDLNLVAMDFNTDMLAGMRHRELPAMLSRRVQADVLHLPLRDKSVDLLINMRLMHHIPDRAVQVSMYRQIARVSRGPVITSFWTTHCWRHIRKRLLGKTIRGFPVSPEHFRGVCREAGLAVERMVSVGPAMEEQTVVICRVEGRG